MATLLTLPLLVLWKFDEDELVPKDLLQTLMTNHHEEYQKHSIDSFIIDSKSGDLVKID